MSEDYQNAISDWVELLGKESVLLGAQALRPYQLDTTGSSRKILAALRPSSVEKPGELVQALIRVAQRHKIAVYPISTGKNWGYGTSLPAVNDCVILDLSQFARILDFDEELGVVTLEPGVTQAGLAEFLDKKGYNFLVPVTGAGPSCSILGNALERGYGVTPITDHFGAVTDIEAVLADGSIYRSALHEIDREHSATDSANLKTKKVARLFKWGIGPYMNGLFTQSGFGIVTKISILLARKPENTKVCLFSIADDDLLDEAIERVQKVLRTLPGIVGGCNLMNQHRMLAMAAPYPRDAIGADGMIPGDVIQAMGKQYQILPWTGFMTLYGSKTMIAAAQKEIRKIMRGVATRMLFLSQGQAQRLAKLTSLLPGSFGGRIARTTATLAKSLELVNGRPNETALPLAYWRNPKAPQGEARDPGRDGCGLLWYAPLVPMQPKAVREYIELVKRVTKVHGIEPLITLTTLNDKVFDSTIPILFDANDENQTRDAQQCNRELLELGANQGFLPYRLGVASMPWLQERMGSAGQLNQKLRKALDPNNLLSPGRYS